MEEFAFSPWQDAGSLWSRRQASLPSSVVCFCWCNKVILKHLIYVEFSVILLWVTGSGEEIGTESSYPSLCPDWKLCLRCKYLSSLARIHGTSRFTCYLERWPTSWTHHSFRQNILERKKWVCICVYWAESCHLDWHSTRNSRASASWVLALQACTTTPGYNGGLQSLFC